MRLTLLNLCLSLKPYGEMPDKLVWTNDSFIGASKYNIKIVKRDNN